MFAVGEIHTGLVQHSTALSPSQCADLLGLRAGERVLQSDRPNSYAMSPEILTGIDCQLPSRSGRRVRAAGTVCTRSTVTGGRIVQGSSHATVAQGRRRNAWSSYLGQPGRIEAIGALDVIDLRDGFIEGRPTAVTLDVGAISGRAVDNALGSAWFDRMPPLRTARKQFRWVLMTSDIAGTEPMAAFTIRDADMRTLVLVVDPVDAAQLPHVVALCEDLALHDWLLTTMISLVRSVQSGKMSAKQKTDQLMPVLEHLIHLWLPAARVPDEVMSVWRDIESHPGFSRQWNTAVEWVRDQITVGSVALLQAAASGIASTGSAARSRADA
jgi:hypothetical protein